MFDNVMQFKVGGGIDEEGMLIFCFVLKSLFLLDANGLPCVQSGITLFRIC